MRYLLIGKNGQLGWELNRALAPLGTGVAVDYPEIDLRRPETVTSLLREFRPQVILNATAYTAVDRAESEAEAAHAINAIAPGVLAEEAQILGAVLIHYSTDYVFDGSQGRPYVEDDVPHPLSVYGRTKLDGETHVLQTGGPALILRTAWVYSLRRDSFVTKVLQWARQQATLRVVSDQISNPTWARLLAETTALLIARGGTEPAGWLSERAGVYHLAGSGHASRLEWAQEILKHDPHPEEQTAREVLPALTADFPTPAERPLFSALDCTRFTETFGLCLPPWQDGLRLAMEPA